MSNDNGTKVAHFDSSGNRLTDISDAEFDGVVSVTTDQSNFYVLSSNNRKVIKFDSNWTKLGSWTVTYRPVALSAKFGSYCAVLEITGGSNGWVEVFNTSGTRIYGPWEISGANTPNGIAVVPSGNSVVIADTDNARILQYSIAGIYEGSFGSFGTGVGEYEFAVPRAVDVDSSGNIYVVDGGNNRFSVYGSNFSFRGRYQGTQGTGDGQFRSPYGITVDSSGNVYVSNSIGDNIQKFKKNQ